MQRRAQLRKVRKGGEWRHASRPERRPPDLDAARRGPRAGEGPQVRVVDGEGARAEAERREREKREREEAERAKQEERERLIRERKERQAARGTVTGVRGTRASMRGYARGGSARGAGACRCRVTQASSLINACPQPQMRARDLEARAVRTEGLLLVVDLHRGAYHGLLEDGYYGEKGKVRRPYTIRISMLMYVYTRCIVLCIGWISTLLVCRHPVGQW